MKLCSLTVVLGLLLLSCTKDNAAYQQQITGSWEMVKQTGGVAGPVQYEAGNRAVFIFDSSQHFIQEYPGAITFNGGTFSIQPSVRPGDWLLTLQYRVPANGQFLYQVIDSIRFVNNQLVVLPNKPCCDIPTSFYARFR